MGDTSQGQALAIGSGVAIGIGGLTIASRAPNHIWFYIGLGITAFGVLLLGTALAHRFIDGVRLWIEETPMRYLNAKNRTLALGIVIGLIIGVASGWGLPQIIPSSSPCPPHGPIFSGSEIIQIRPGSGKETWRLAENLYRPPGSTGARGAFIKVLQAGSVLWSDDGTRPNRIAEAGDGLWVCGARIPRFQVSPRSEKEAALSVTYAW